MATNEGELPKWFLEWVKSEEKSIDGELNLSCSKKILADDEDQQGEGQWIIQCTEKNKGEGDHTVDDQDKANDDSQLLVLRLEKLDKVGKSNNNGDSCLCCHPCSNAAKSSKKPTDEKPTSNDTAGNATTTTKKRGNEATDTSSIPIMKQDMEERTDVWNTLGLWISSWYKLEWRRSGLPGTKNTTITANDNITAISSTTTTISTTDTTTITTTDSSTATVTNFTGDNQNKAEGQTVPGISEDVVVEPECKYYSETKSIEIEQELKQLLRKELRRLPEQEAHHQDKPCLDKLPTALHTRFSHMFKSILQSEINQLSKDLEDWQMAPSTPPVEQDQPLPAEQDETQPEDAE